MKKLLVIAVLTIGLNVQAQKWVKALKNEDPEVKDVYHYVIDKDTLAEKWTILSTKEKLATSQFENEYYILWKVNDVNYLSFTFKNSFLPVEKEKDYNVVILMNDYSTIKDLAYISKQESQIEIIVHLKPEDVDLLKTKLLQGIKIDINNEISIIDNQDNDMKSESIQKMANIIWPDIAKKKV